MSLPAPLAHRHWLDHTTYIEETTTVILDTNLKEACKRVQQCDKGLVDNDELIETATSGDGSWQT